MAINMSPQGPTRQQAQGVAPGYWICAGCRVVHSIIAQSTYLPLFGHLCKKCCTPEMEREAAGMVEHADNRH